MCIRDRPVPRRYSYLEKSETLKVPEELPVSNRVVNEEGEAEEEKRNNFCGSIQECDYYFTRKRHCSLGERHPWICLLYTSRCV